MPLIVQTHQTHADTPAYFARVLKDQPQVANLLAERTTELLVVEGVFNDNPVALLLAEPTAQGSRLLALVSHPATRGRGVGREVLQKGSKLLPQPVEWADELSTLAERFLK